MIGEVGTWGNDAYFGNDAYIGGASVMVGAMPMPMSMPMSLPMTKVSISNQFMFFSCVMCVCAILVGSNLTSHILLRSKRKESDQLEEEQGRFSLQLKHSYLEAANFFAHPQGKGDEQRYPKNEATKYRLKGHSG